MKWYHDNSSLPDSTDLSIIQFIRLMRDIKGYLSFTWLDVSESVTSPNRTTKLWSHTVSCVSDHPTDSSIMLLPLPVLNIEISIKGS